MTHPILYFTDLHVNRYNQFSEHHDRLKDCLKVINDAFKFIDKVGGKTILFGGDMGDLPKWIYIDVIDSIIKCLSNNFRKFPHITMVAISGNHDHNTKNLIDKPAKTLLSVFAVAFPDRFILIDNEHYFIPGAITFGIPYYEYPEHYSKALEAQVELATGMSEEFPEVSKILLIHQTPEGIYNKHIKADTNPNDPRYKHFDIVLDGHIHKKQIINPRFIIGGNPLHRDLGDIGDEKGMWVMDASEPVRTLDFISRKGRYPEFVVMKQEDITDEVKHTTFAVPDMTEQKVTLPGSADANLFASNLSKETLITNFWKQMEGKNERLLKTGLSLI